MDSSVESTSTNAVASSNDVTPSNDVTSSNDVTPSNDVTSSNDVTPPVSDNGFRRVVYKRRWYILLIYSVTTFIQCYIWSMWGPIYYSMEKAYGWNKTQLALMPLAGGISFIFVAMPSTWLLEKWRLRRIMLLMTGLVFFSVLIRCIPLDGKTGSNILMNISAYLNGVPGAFTFYIPTVISARWFAPNQRKLSTSIGALMNSFGLAATFIIGPLFVPEPGDDVTVADIKQGYETYTYVQTAISGFIFLCEFFDFLLLFIYNLFLGTIIYYPERPPTAPSASAETERIDFKHAFIVLLKSRDFWLLSLILSLTFGVYAGWISVLTISLGRNGIDEKTAGYVGFYGILVGASVGIVAASIADRTGHLKAYMVALCLLSFESAVWLVLVCNNYLTFSMTSVYMAVIISSVAANLMLPINFELSAEMCYPVDESVVVGLSGVVSNIFTCLFLGVLLVKETGVVWMNYAYATTTLLSIPLVCLLNAKYKRSIVDYADID